MNASYIADSHGHAVLARLDQHVADLVEALDASLPADEQLLAGANEIAAARGGVVAFERLEQGIERDVQCAETVREHLHFVGLQLPAERVDLDDPGDRAQLISNEPVEHGAQLHRRVALLSVRLPSGAHIVGAHLELEDLTEARAERAELRRRAGGETLTCLYQPLGDELPRAKQVRALLEHDRHC